jgi:YD repeat-containing protein
VQVIDPLGTTRNFSFGYQGSKLAVTSADLPTPGFANAATRVQNPDGTLASETDYQGNTTQYTWESPRRLPLSTTRAAGTPLAQTTSGQWHASLPLKTASATPGRITTWVYNGFPDPFNGGATASCAPATALLPDGSSIVVL